MQCRIAIKLSDFCICGKWTVLFCSCNFDNRQNELRHNTTFCHRKKNTVCIQLQYEQQKLKICENLRTPSLNLKCTDSNEKMYNSIRSISKLRESRLEIRLKKKNKLKTETKTHNRKDQKKDLHWLGKFGC